MKKRLIFLVSACLFLFVFVLPGYCLRPRVRKSKKSSGSKTSYASRGIKALVRFRPDRKGLLIDFSNFTNIESISYELIYEANGLSQGVGGVAAIGDSETKNLYFGTCSSGVCTPHRNITNARLSIKSVLKDGTVILKPFRIKV